MGHKNYFKMTIADFFVYLGLFATGSGLIGMLLEIVLTLWGVDTGEWLMKVSITMLLLGFIVFMVAGAFGGCPECFRHSAGYYR